MQRSVTSAMTIGVLNIIHRVVLHEHITNVVSMHFEASFFFKLLGTKLSYVQSINIDQPKSTKNILNRDMVRRIN